MAAVVAGVVHLVAAPNVLEFDEVLAVLFVLNGVGFLGLTAVYLSRYMRRWLYLVLAAYSLVTILALFAVQGWGVEAFYMGDQLNPLAVVSKAAETVVVVTATYLYVSSE